MKRSIIIFILAVSHAACSSTGDSAPTSAAAPVATAPASTTTASTSTSTSTTSPTTTLPPTTTPVAATPEALIEQAVQDYSQAYHECGAAPATCDPASFTAIEGPSRLIITKFAADMVDQGLYFLPDTRGSYAVLESVDVVSASEATAIFCVYDAGTVMGPVGPDGQPTVVNDEILSFRNQYRLYLDRENWLVGEKTEIDNLGEGNLCPPAA